MSVPRFLPPREEVISGTVPPDFNQMTMSEIASMSDSTPSRFIEETIQESAPVTSLMAPVRSPIVSRSNQNSLNGRSVPRFSSSRTPVTTRVTSSRPVSQSQLSSALSTPRSSQNSVQPLSSSVSTTSSRASQPTSPVSTVSPRSSQPSSPVSIVSPRSSQPSSPVSIVSPRSSQPSSPVSPRSSQPSSPVSTVSPRSSQPSSPVSPRSSQPSSPVSPVSPRSSQPTSPVSPVSPRSSQPTSPVSPVSPRSSQPSSTVGPSVSQRRATVPISERPVSPIVSSGERDSVERISSPTMSTRQDTIEMVSPVDDEIGVISGDDDFLFPESTPSIRETKSPTSLSHVISPTQKLSPLDSLVMQNGSSIKYGSIRLQPSNNDNIDTALKTLGFHIIRKYSTDGETPKSFIYALTPSGDPIFIDNDTDRAMTIDETVLTTQQRDTDNDDIVTMLLSIDDNNNDIIMSCIDGICHRSGESVVFYKAENNDNIDVNYPHTVVKLSTVLNDVTNSQNLSPSKEMVRKFVDDMFDDMDPSKEIKKLEDISKAFKSDARLAEKKLDESTKLLKDALIYNKAQYRVSNQRQVFENITNAVNNLVYNVEFEKQLLAYLRYASKLKSEISDLVKKYADLTIALQENFSDEVLKSIKLPPK